MYKFVSFLFIVIGAPLVAQNSVVYVNEYFHANKTELDTQKDPKVAMGTDSGFGVVWLHTYKNSEGITKDDVYARLFDKNGKALSNELKVNDDPNTYTNNFKYSIASNGSGKTCIAYGAAPDGQPKGAFVRCYDKNGNDLTGVLLVDNTSDAWTSPETGVKVFDDGSFVVVYQYEAGFTTGYKAKRFSNANVGQTEYWVNDQGGGARTNDIKVSGNKTGSFIVTWTINDFNLKTLVTVVNASDEKVITDMIVDDPEDNVVTEENPAVTMDSNGRFAVTYLKKSSSDSSDHNLTITAFSADGSVVKKVLVPTTVKPDIPNIASNDSKITVTWSDNSLTEIVRTYTIDWSGNEVSGISVLQDDYALDRQDQIDPDIAMDDKQKVVIWTDKYREEYEYSADRNTSLDEGIFGAVTKRVNVSPAIINLIID